MKRSTFFVIILAVILAVSIFFNLRFLRIVLFINKFGDLRELLIVTFKDANTRPTYETFHKIKEAQKYASGKEIKVGIIDHYFGYLKNKNLYAGGTDIIGNKDAFENIGEHGFWMATTLREIAPNVEIFAINALGGDNSKVAEAIQKSVDWAIENKINILTYSSQKFRNEDRKAIDNIVEKAIKNNITIVFLHYDYENNILPYGFLPKDYEGYRREYDVNIFHFDYNTLLQSNYQNYIKAGRVMEDNGDMPYFSFSSMPVVLAGIISLMKETNNELSPAEIKKILIETSKEITYKDYKVKKVADAESAVKYAIQLTKEKFSLLK
jgi:hypothetical protein